MPLLPGYHGDDQSPEVLKAAADDMGYPVLLKAVAGGGGKGMRQVHGSETFTEALVTAKREAMSSFADDAMLVEKFLTRPRHVEVQVFFDQSGNGVYLFERDCSVQRRHQKIIEEAPAPNMTEALRRSIGDAAVKAGEAINYVGAGTVEFLLDEDGTFYFMEMNTRLQVEHPVTEYITKQDLVEWQLRVAVGEPLPMAQDELQIFGHSFEARIYAEDTDNQFLPQTGKLHYYAEPAESEYVRVDSGVVQGDEVSVFYDPMIAKLITWDTDRNRALSRLSSALNDFHVSGVTVNVPFLNRLAEHPAFVAAELSTAFISEHEDELFSVEAIDAALVAKLALYLALAKQSGEAVLDPWQSRNHWRLNLPSSCHYDLVIGSETYRADISFGRREFNIRVNESSFVCSGSLNNEQLSFVCNDAGGSATVYFDGESGKWFGADCQIEFRLAEKDFGDGAGQDSLADFNAPMNGTIVQVSVSAGQKVSAGETLVVMEAMKMEHAIHAPSDGVVTELFCQEGELVDGGATLLAFEGDES